MESSDTEKMLIESHAAKNLHVKSILGPYQVYPNVVGGYVMFHFAFPSRLVIQVAKQKHDNIEERFQEGNRH